MLDDNVNDRTLTVQPQQVIAAVGDKHAGAGEDSVRAAARGRRVQCTWCVRVLVVAATMPSHITAHFVRQHDIVTPREARHSGPRSGFSPSLGGAWALSNWRKIHGRKYRPERGSILLPENPSTLARLPWRCLGSQY